MGLRGTAYRQLSEKGNLEQAEALLAMGSDYVRQYSQSATANAQAAGALGTSAASVMNAAIERQAEAADRAAKAARDQAEHLQAIRHVESAIARALEKIANESPKETGEAVAFALDGAIRAGLGESLSFGDPEPVEVVLDSLIRDGALARWDHDNNREIPGLLVRTKAISDPRSCRSGAIVSLHPQRDSNPCYRRERAGSWAARRWGPDCIEKHRVHAGSPPKPTAGRVRFRRAAKARVGCPSLGQVAQLVRASA
jgi:hypothetical protein